jgi:acyl carrier protein
MQSVLLRLLSGVAPEADRSRLRPESNIREELDIDSMDLLNFVVGVEKELGVAIPEADYPRVRTLGALLDYLQAAPGTGPLPRV